MLRVTEVGLRQMLARVLVVSRSSDAFLRLQLSHDPAPAVRATIVQAIMADSRWTAKPETPDLIKAVVARDPDLSVSLAALEALRRWQMRGLNALLNDRLKASSGGAGAPPPRAPYVKMISPPAASS